MSDTKTICRVTLYANGSTPASYKVTEISAKETEKRFTFTIERKNSLPRTRHLPKEEIGVVTDRFAEHVIAIGLHAYCFPEEVEDMKRKLFREALSTTERRFNEAKAVLHNLYDLHINAV